MRTSGGKYQIGIPCLKFTEQYLEMYLVLGRTRFGHEEKHPYSWYKYNYYELINLTKLTYQNSIVSSKDYKFFEGDQGLYSSTGTDLYKVRLLFFLCWKVILLFLNVKGLTFSVFYKGFVIRKGDFL